MNQLASKYIFFAVSFFQLNLSPCFSLFTDQSSMPPSSLSLCSETRVTQFIRQYVASCLLVSDSNTELSYILPSEAVRKGCFERLFQVNNPVLTISFNLWYMITITLTVSFLLPGSGAEFGQSGSHQLWCDGHHTGGGLSKSLRGRSVT